MSKKILGLDLGTNSIGWALVNEAEISEHSSITKLGVRAVPLTTDESLNFSKGKTITTNADRTLKKSARINLQRFKLRRSYLIETLKENNLITDNTILAETGNHTTFQTINLRAKAVKEEVSLEELSRIFLMINKKRGYKSSRKVKSDEEGQLIDGMEIAKYLYDNNLTPGEYVYNLLKKNQKNIPDFYRSDLQNELDKIWTVQEKYYPEILTSEFKEQLKGKGKQNSSKLFLGKYKIFTAENKGSNVEKKLQAYKWRIDAIHKQLNIEEVAFVISEVNGEVNGSSNYLGAISDRSKELYFRKQTVGEYLVEKLNQNPNFSLKNQVFYRQDYLDEFNTIWEKQKEYHSELTEDLKHEIRDIIIFYQRRLKSQKALLSFCEFESEKIEVDVNGKKKTKTIGQRVTPRSSLWFQEFKIWQILNNIEISNKKTREKRQLNQEEKEQLAQELTYREKISKTEMLKLLFENHSELDANFKTIDGNKTLNSFLEKSLNIIEQSGHEINTTKMNMIEVKNVASEILKSLGCTGDFLTFDSDIEGSNFTQQTSVKLWHLIYSFEGDNSRTGNEKLILKISQLLNISYDYARILASTNLQDDYSNLSTKAIRKILPHLKDGNAFDVACALAGYRHSKNSLTKDEIENKKLKEKLDLLPKNSLRNPVVEKILNQMINVINQISETYGKPDEIRIELARELKRSAKEREDMTEAINKATSEHEKYKKVLQTNFGLSHISRNDIIRYKLYLELESNGFKTLYSDTYITPGKLFSKEFDIEHIIPQAKLFDDSFSNKTLEARAVNIEKADTTAFDYVSSKYGETGIDNYTSRIEKIFKDGKISKTKYQKLLMTSKDIPSDFIQRDLRDTQYIAKKAKSILDEYVKTVVSTSGSITDRLRQDWQLIDIMKELNWDKYELLGLTEIIENRDGQKIKRIKDWSKRNDHRHHAMDALTVAFTKPSYIQYLNNLNARSDKASSIYAIENKEMYRNENNKLLFKPPMPLDIFRTEAKKHLEEILVSIKAKNKVVTKNINKTKKKGGYNEKIQQTPRGQLHLETVYGSIKQYVTKEEKVNASFNQEKINTVCKKAYREALLNRFLEFEKDPKKAFTGKNSLEKNPIWLDEQHSLKVPEKVKTVGIETIYTIRKPIDKDLKIEKVIDRKVKEILENRLKEHNGDSKIAFSNLDENPIWLNKEKGIALKRVTIKGVSNAVALHDKKDHFGKLILDENNNTQAVDFVNTGNNHHVAIYKDEKGVLQEKVISFFEATSRANLGYSIIDKDYKKTEGWTFLFSMKQNEYFVFPNEKTGFNPKEIDLLDPENYALISPNLFRIQKFTNKDYFFRHHFETNVENNENLKGITWIRQGLNGIDNIVKVRINYIGKIVLVGEY